MGFTVSQGAEAQPGGTPTPATSEQREKIRARIKQLNEGALLLGVVGLGLQAFGRASQQSLLLYVGSGVMVVALAIYARMRGRSPWWGALGLLSLLGLIALYLLPKRCHHCGATVKGKSCAACGAPAPL